MDIPPTEEKWQMILSEVFAWERWITLWYSIHLIKRLFLPMPSCPEITRGTFLDPLVTGAFRKSSICKKYYSKPMVFLRSLKIVTARIPLTVELVHWIQSPYNNSKDWCRTRCSSRSPRRRSRSISGCPNFYCSSLSKLYKYK